MINAFDYMTAAEILDVKSRTAMVDVTLAVQAAINSRQLGGETVLLPAGLYMCGQLSLLSDINLIGEGGGATTLFYKNGSNGYGLLLGSLSNVRIADMTLAGNSANNLTGGQGVRVQGNSTKILLERVRVTDWRYDGVAVDTSSRVKAVNSEFDYNLRDGVQFSVTTQALVTNCDVHHNGRFGIIFGTSCSYIRNIGNDLYSNSIITKGAGAATVSSNDVVMLGNIARGNTLGHGLQFNATKRGIYSGNISMSNGISGLDFTLSSQYGVASGNISYSNSIRGIEIDSTSFYVTATGNGVYRNGEVGISVYRTPATVLVGNFSTENGTTLSPKYGIRLWDDAGGMPSNNCVLIGNVASDDRGAGATQKTGLQIDGPTTGVVAIGNAFTSYASGGTPVMANPASIMYKAGNLGWV